MASFSERYGYTKPCDVLQLESVNRNLRISIYNIYYQLFGEYNRKSFVEDLYKRIWGDFWHYPLDEFPNSYPTFYRQLQKWVLSCEWYLIYDLIEFVSEQCEELDSDEGEYGTAMWGFPANETKSPSFTDDYRSIINTMLAREHAGYRMVGSRIVPIANDSELSSLGQALDAPDSFKTARDHMARALTLFAKRPNPDYTNTVKEAISAVEAAAQVVAQEEKATLRKTLASIQKTYSVHPALVDGWKKLYGFTSDAGGIRHAEHPDDVHVDGPFAKYMLISCSAFVNYLIEISIPGAATEETD